MSPMPQNKGRNMLVSFHRPSSKPTGRKPLPKQDVSVTIEVAFLSLIESTRWLILLTTPVSNKKETRYLGNVKELIGHCPHEAGIMMFVAYL